MKLIEIKISRYKKMVNGIEIKNGNQWCLIYDNPVDYIIDGYKYINKVFIRKVTSVSENEISYKIIKLKYNDEISKEFDAIPLNDYINFFMILKKHSVLIQIGLESDEYTLVGKVINVFEKSFVLEKISTDANIIGRENIKFSIVRCIEMKTDYLNSLELYLNTSDIEK